MIGTTIALSLLFVVSLVLWGAARRMETQAKKDVARSQEMLDEAERLLKYAIYQLDNAKQQRDEATA